MDRPDAGDPAKLSVRGRESISPDRAAGLDRGVSGVLLRAAATFRYVQFNWRDTQFEQGGPFSSHLTRLSRQRSHPFRDLRWGLKGGIVGIPGFTLVVVLG